MFPRVFLRVNAAAASYLSPLCGASAARRANSSLPRQPLKIGFIGLGNMGRPMALNLLRAGHALTAFDASPGIGWEAAVRGAGGAVAASAGAAAAGADAVVTMLPSSPHVRSVYEGAGGVFELASPGALLLDCSTIDPRASASLAAAAAARAGGALRMIDAPVSGGVGGAEGAALTFMVGGSADNFEAARPLLAAMGRSIVHCGAPGAGQIAKLVNNYILGTSMVRGHAAAQQEAPHFLSSLRCLPRSARCWAPLATPPAPPSRPPHNPTPPRPPSPRR